LIRHVFGLKAAITPIPPVDIVDDIDNRKRSHHVVDVSKRSFAFAVSTLLVI
jgi:hypothetical protein